MFGRWAELRPISSKPAFSYVLNRPVHAKTLPPFLRGSCQSSLAAGHADLVAFDPSRVRDTATYENPHQYANGIPHVWVNGVLVIQAGEQTDARPGKVLRPS